MTTRSSVSIASGALSIFDLSASGGETSRISSFPSARARRATTGSAAPPASAPSRPTPGEDPVLEVDLRRADELRALRSLSHTSILSSGLPGTIVGNS